MDNNTAVKISTDTKQKENNFNSNTHTVSSIIHFVTKSIHTDFDNKCIILEGVFIKKNDKLYESYYYDYIGDTASQAKISAKIPALIRDKLTNNKAYKFEGFVVLAPYKDTYNILFTVNKLVEEKVEYVDENIKKYYEILKKKEFKQNVDRIVQKILSTNNKVKFAFIFGETAIIDEDVYEQLGDYNRYYEIDEYKTVLKPQSLIDRLKEIENLHYDFIAIARGGGDLDTFNDLTLVDYCATYKIPIVSAIGHTEDHTYLDAISDKMFYTPTAFGVWLKDIVDEFNNNVEELRKNNIKQLREEITNEIKKTYDKILEEKIKSFENSIKEKDNLVKDKIEQIKKMEQNMEKLLLEKNTYLVEKEKLRHEREKYVKDIENTYKQQIDKFMNKNKILTISLYSVGVVLLIIIILLLIK